IFLKKTQNEWILLLSEREVCFTPVQNLKDVLMDSRFREREMVFQKIGRDGEITYEFGVPVKMSRTPGKLRTRPEGFGQGTRGILLELGYSEEQVDQFFEQGIV
ncbi:MAG: CoA transferase, partial [Deltaproteobacteria bacterium]|nr:CoA transferase [Deltaproteobacteria bacterium]